MRSAARSGAGRAGEELRGWMPCPIYWRIWTSERSGRGHSQIHWQGISGNRWRGEARRPGERSEEARTSHGQPVRCSSKQRRASQPRLRQCREEERSGFWGRRCLRAEQREDRLRGRRSSQRAVQAEALLPKQALERQNRLGKSNEDWKDPEEGCRVLCDFRFEERR